MRLSRSLLIAVVLVVAGFAVLPRWCARDRRVTIRVEEHRVVVTNLTGGAWSDVTVWLNDYYRAQAPALAPDQRLEIPLNAFAGGWGRRFDRRREAPVGIEVRARGADGKPFTAAWGRGRRR